MYRILRLRTDVFVVEQQCPYPELDGRDLEPGARWAWAIQDGDIVATLRILTDGTGPDDSRPTDSGPDDSRPTARIGRVATALSARSAGTASVLMRYALEAIAAGTPVVLDAQLPLEGWYQRFGFVRDGAEFVEDGIRHVPMRRPAVYQASRQAKTPPAGQDLTSS
jgi:ElaA protein